ncbi:MAG: hypothetical protein O3C40_05010 [Planctomycetota bacterium]|nr:hypothetical protein [Planctomycetota bacterium]
MSKLFSMTLVALTFAMLSATASAQVVTGPIITSYRPITDAAATITYSPVIESATTTNDGPVVTFSPVLPQATTVYSQPVVIVARPFAQPTTTYSPFARAPIITYRPVTPVVVAHAPIVTYRPAFPVYAAPVPVITYRQPVTAYAVPAAPFPVYSATTYGSFPVVAARPVIVSPKVYVPGQPIRNVLRAITP